VAYSLALDLYRLDRLDELQNFTDENQRMLDATNLTYLLLLLRDNERVIRVADEALQSEPTDYVSRINRAIAFKRLGRSCSLMADLLVLKTILDSGRRIAFSGGRHALAAGVAALERNKAALISNL
jgi:hypothetical protein